MLSDGCDKVLVVLTRPKGYIKECRKSDILIARRIEKKYPAVARALVHRYKKYNRSVKLCEELEKQGRAVILRPEHPLKSMEKDVKVLRRSWQEGYDLAAERMSEIKALFH